MGCATGIGLSLEGNAGQYCIDQHGDILYHTPKANVFAERWVWSVREECLDHILVLNESRLHRVLKEYAGYYNYARPH
jgi:hypothetical protein